MLLLKNRGVGFTLVEVLVVIAVLAVLVGVALSLVRTAQQTAWRTQSASNLRGLAGAALTYTTENNGDFPLTTHSAGMWFTRTWNWQLRPYLGDDPKAFVCPEDPHYETRLSEGTSSYTMNGYLDPLSYPQFGQPAKLSDPGNTVLFYYQAVRDNYRFDDHTHASNWTSWAAITADIAPDWFSDEERSADHSTGFSYYSFADGHIESIDAVDFRRYVASQPNAAIPKADLDKLSSN